MRRSLTALLFVGSSLFALSCGTSEEDLQNQSQARRDSLAQALAQREAGTDSTATEASSSASNNSQVTADFDPSGRFVVQVGSWRSETKASDLVDVWKQRGYDSAYMESYGNESTGDVWFRVRLGNMASRPEADALVNQLKQRHGLSAWVDTMKAP
jgi:cell division septation protein DedD